jgi:hypothetical protein
MIRRIGFPALIAAAVLLPLAALADPYSDLVKAHDAFKAAKSWHAVEHFSNGRTMTIDFSAPDRWRVQPMPNMTELVIGSDVYMVRNGKSMKMPMGGEMIRNQIQSAGAQPMDPSIKQTVKDLGMQTVNGKSVHGYSYTAQGQPVTMYVGADSLPVESIVKTPRGTVTVDYSNYNVPVTIAP